MAHGNGEIVTISPAASVTLGRAGASRDPIADRHAAVMFVVYTCLRRYPRDGEDDGCTGIIKSVYPSAWPALASGCAAGSQPSPALQIPAFYEMESLEVLDREERKQIFPSGARGERFSRCNT